MFVYGFSLALSLMEDSEKSHCTGVGEVIGSKAGVKGAASPLAEREVSSHFPLPLCRRRRQKDLATALGTLSGSIAKSAKVG